MKELSRIALAIEPSATMAIDSMFKQMKADGLDVIGFGAGEPDFPTPDYIKEVGIQAIQNNDTKYTPSVGTVALRKAICQRLKADCGVEYTPQQISVSNGAKPCVYVALRALINPGDEVILPSPYWVSYSELIKMTGGVPVIVETREADHFKLTAQELRDAITPKTKAMILNNPSNPTGMMYSRKELEEIAKVCVEKDIYVISDEIYYRLAYDNEEFVSFAALGEDVKARTLLVNGVSKSYAMTGWRIGYVAAPAAISKVIGNYLGHCTGSPSSISQAAAAEALSTSQETVEKMREAFEERRNYMVERMNQIEGVSCIKPEGAFYLYVKSPVENEKEFCEVCKQYNVLVVPGSSFACPGYVRIAYCVSYGQIERSLPAFRKIAEHYNLV